MQFKSVDRISLFIIEKCTELKKNDTNLLFGTHVTCKCYLKRRKNLGNVFEKGWNRLWKDDACRILL